MWAVVKRFDSTFMDRSVPSSYGTHAKRKDCKHCIDRKRLSPGDSEKRCHHPKRRCIHSVQCSQSCFHHEHSYNEPQSFVTERSECREMFTGGNRRYLPRRHWSTPWQSKIPTACVKNWGLNAWTYSDILCVPGNSGKSGITTSGCSRKKVLTSLTMVLHTTLRMFEPSLTF